MAIFIKFSGGISKHPLATLNDQAMENLGQIDLKIDQMKKKPDSDSLLALVIPHHLIKDLALLANDVDAHTEAVLRGRTNIKQKEHIRWSFFW